MKILCVIDNLGSGGAQRQLVNLAIGFKEYGYKVSFLVYHHHNFYQDILNENQIQVKSILEPNYLRRILQIRSFIRNGSFDTVLSFLESPNFICEIAGFPRKKWKLIVGERSANPKILKSPKLIIFRWFHIFADCIVSNSHENLKMVRILNPLLQRNKCHVIYNLIDFEKWKPSTGFVYRQNGKLRILVAASHQFLKNLNGLVEAVNKLSIEEKEILEIHWYGGSSSDDSKANAEKKISQLGLERNFYFHDPIREIDIKMKTYDAVGLFSFHEGFPNAICEAMSLSKPVIASAISDIPQLIQNNRLLINPSVIESIRNSLSYLLNMSTTDLIFEGEKNFLTSQKYFNKSEIIQKYLTLINH